MISGKYSGQKPLFLPQLPPHPQILKALFLFCFFLFQKNLYSSSLPSFSLMFLLSIRCWVGGGGEKIFCQKVGQRGVKYYCKYNQKFLIPISKLTQTRNYCWSFTFEDEHRLRIDLAVIKQMLSHNELQSFT